MSGSGPRKVVISTRERAVSGDLNRLQAMLAASQAESLLQHTSPLSAGKRGPR